MNDVNFLIYTILNEDSIRKFLILASENPYFYGRVSILILLLILCPFD